MTVSSIGDIDIASLDGSGDERDDMVTHTKK